MKEKWTYDVCKAIALKFNNRNDLKKEYYQVHYKIYKKKWYELLSHMTKLASKKERCVYFYIFEDASVYVGLTCNLKQRHKGHQINGAVYEHAKNNSLTIPKPKQLTDYINYVDASFIETEIINELRKCANVNLLNREKGGGLGAWTIEKSNKEKCISDVKKCGNKTQLLLHYYDSYVFFKNNYDEFDDEYKNFFNKNHRKTEIVSFDVNGNFYKKFNSIKEAMVECETKQVSEAVREHYFSNNFYFMNYNEWLEKGKPMKVISKEEKNKIAHKETIKKRTEKFKKYGHSLKGVKKTIEYRIKKSKPIVMTDFNYNVIDVLYGISFAKEKYDLPKKFLKSVYGVRNKLDKSLCGYRWFTLDFYNKTFNKELTCEK